MALVVGPFVSHPFAKLLPAQLRAFSALIICSALSITCVFCSGVEYDDVKGTLSFSSLHLGTLALLGDRSRLLPYRSWSIRPTGGYGGSTAEITLEVRIIVFPYFWGSKQRREGVVWVWSVILVTICALQQNHSGCLHVHTVPQSALQWR